MMRCRIKGERWTVDLCVLLLALNNCHSYWIYRLGSARENIGKGSQLPLLYLKISFECGKPLLFNSSTRGLRANGPISGFLFNILCRSFVSICRSPRDRS